MFWQQMIGRINPMIGCLRLRHLMLRTSTASCYSVAPKSESSLKHTTTSRFEQRRTTRQLIDNPNRSSIAGKNRQQPIVSAEKRRPAQIEDIVQPISITTSAAAGDGSAVDDMIGPMDKTSIMTALSTFVNRPEIMAIAAEHHIGEKIFHKVYMSFRAYCLSLSTESKDADLRVMLSDVVNGGYSVDVLIPYFLQHAKRVYPHLEGMHDLKHISDLTQPHKWYPEARTIIRRIVYHCGPTNSGKTYSALQRFNMAKSGVYCGPLRLLASEVYQRTNAEGIACDMITGEERRYIVDSDHPSTHLASTVEMISTSTHVEVAVIDEIQMLRDVDRGWAWTRALLGVFADEVHICGEASAIDIVRALLEPIGEIVEVIEYERKTPLVVMDTAMVSLNDIQEGDCIVCFGRKAIYTMCQKLEKVKIKPAIIYGDLPPGTKLAQAEKFNNREDGTTVLLATDAIGMGLNLNIRRIIFHRLEKPPTNELITNYHALQIAGRAGRFGFVGSDDSGYVTTLHDKDINQLKRILAEPIEPLSAVGIAPTFEMIEMFSFYLPHATLSNLLDIFVSMCSVDKKYFMCQCVDQMKELADVIEKVNLPLKTRYTFCLAPIDVEMNAIGKACFLKISRKYSNDEPITYQWFKDAVGWPCPKPTTIADLVKLEQIYSTMDLYLWLSVRFPVLDCTDEIDL